jgi:hypothetical protein
MNLQRQRVSRTWGAVNCPRENLVIFIHENGGAERDQELAQRTQGSSLRNIN